MPGARDLRQAYSRSAFTIIELLIVMAIIIVLAGLILGTSGYVQKKGARSRAEAEIAAMSAALESYKADNGVYPRSPGVTEPTAAGGSDGLSASHDPSPEDPVYTNASRFLYQQLSGDSNGDRALDNNAKQYFAFKPQMLSPRDATQTVAAIRDPFGNAYGYSTANQMNPDRGRNPTFDLWSTGGTTGTGGAGAINDAEWIKNW